MVLAEFGEQLLSLFEKLSLSNTIDDEIFQRTLKEFSSILLKNDVNINIVAKLKERVKSRFVECDNKVHNRSKLLQKLIIDELIKILTTERLKFQPKKGTTNIIMFVGLQGSGKTTTCSKYGWRVGLICADTFRAGAFDQLKQNATKIGVPFYGSYLETDPVKVALDGLHKFVSEKFELIIIDTSGRHKQETELFAEMCQLKNSINPDHIIFVVDSHIGQACYEQAKAFHKAVSVGSVIITKLDGNSKGGGALSAITATNAPISFLGTGEHYDDFELFDSKSFISRLLGMGDIDLLISTVSEVITTEKQSELVQRLSNGCFTIRDMKEQFLNILKMGSLSHFMSLLPGFKSNGYVKKEEKEGMNQVKRFIIIMDSMTDQELDCLKPITKNSLIRIAKGSGHFVRDVQALLDRHKMFTKMFGQMGKSLSKKKMDFPPLSKNAAQIFQSFHKNLNTSILKHVSGNQNIMNMLGQR